MAISLALACGKSTPPAPVHFVDAGAPSPCALVEKLQRIAMDVPGACVLHPKSEKFFRRCVPSRGGAWGLVIDAPKTKQSSDCHALAEAVEFGMASAMSVARAVHVDAHGDLVRSYAFEWGSITDVRAFDYDGDGVDELLVTATTSNAAALMNVDPAHETFGLVWRAGSEAVDPYGPVNVVTFEDVDGDGRPDLVTRERIEGDDGDVSTWFFYGPRRIGHSLPRGDFSFDDGVASASNASECAGVSLATASARTLFEAALCARASGRSVEQIRRDYVARCRELERHATDVSMTAVCRADMFSHGVAMPLTIEALLK